MQETNPSQTLPNYTQAEIDIAKFERYSMDPANIRNQRKWVAFEIVGYDVQDYESRHEAAKEVIDQVRAALPNVPAIPGRMSPHGQRFQVRLQIVGPTGKTGTLVTIWQVDLGKTHPRLITNWLEVHR